MKLFIFVLALSIAIVSHSQAQSTDQKYTWKNVQIVGGGFVSGIIFHPTQKDLIYARTDIGGVYRWNAQRKLWIPLLDWADLDNWSLNGGESVGIDPSDPKRVYIAAGMYTNHWTKTNGEILCSSDQGRSFKRTKMPFKFGGNEDGRSIGERLAVDPNKNSILLFGTRHNGLWRSEDFGETWKQVESFPIKARTNGIGVGIVQFDASSSAKGAACATIYVGAANKESPLFRSNDAGASWEEVEGQPKNLVPHHMLLTVEGNLLVTYGNGPGPNGVTDGAVWKLNTKSGEWTDITPRKPKEHNESFGYAGLSIDASNPNVMVVSTLDWWHHHDELFRSLDGGKTWKGIQSLTSRDCSISPFLTWDKPAADMGHWIGDFEIDPCNPDRAMYVTGATIWTTDNLTVVDKGEVSKWTVGAAGLEETAVLDLLSPPTGAHLISGLGDIGGFRHDNLTLSPKDGLWSDPFITTITSIDFAEQKPDMMVRVGRGKTRQQGAFSHDGGATWRAFPSEPTGADGGGMAAISSDGSAILWSARSASPSITTDQGKTWKRCEGLKGEMLVVADRMNPMKFFAIDVESHSLFISEDGGATFKLQNDKLPPLSKKFRPVPGREGDIWLPTEESGLFHSTDSGASFTKIDSVQHALAVGLGKAAEGKSYPSLFISGQLGGVKGAFRSNDMGETWVRITDNDHQYGLIGETIIGDPRIHGRVYLGTNGRGVLYGDIAESK